MPGAIGNVEVAVKFNVDAASASAAQSIKSSFGSVGESVGKQLDQSITSRLKSFADKGTRAGRQLSFGISAPLAAAGKTALDQFTGFDQAMTRVTALTGVSREQTKAWEGDVKRIALTYGQSASSAAEALYFITSSGIQGSQAIDVLDTSAKMAAVGLGDMQSSADVLTSAMNAYGAENLSASQAGDILTVAVSEGKAEADQFAKSLGRVLPIASAMGVSFDEVTGALAAMTKAGASPEEATTSLRAIFTELSKLPPQSQAALKQFTGLEYSTLRLQIASKGLIPVLKQIRDGLEGNELATTAVFGNTRAATGFFNLFGEKTLDTLRIVDATTKASGKLGRSMEETATSSSFKLQKATESLKTSLVDLGEAVAPVAQSMAEHLGSVVAVFKDLPQPVQSTVVGFGAMLVAAGPLVYSVSSLGNVADGVGSMFQKLSGAVATVAGTAVPAFGNAMAGLSSSTAYVGASFGGSALAAGGLATALGTVGAVAIGVVGSLTILNAASERNQSWANDLAGTLNSKPVKSSFTEFQERLTQTRTQLREMREEQARVTGPGRFMQLPQDWDTAEQLNPGIETLAKYEAQLANVEVMTRQLGYQSTLSNDKISEFLQTELKAGHTFNTVAEALAALNAAQGANNPIVTDQTAKTEEATQTFSALVAKVKDTNDAFFGAIEASNRYKDAQNKIADANQKVTDAEDARTDAFNGTITAQRQYDEAQRRSVDATNRVAESRRALTDAQNELNDALRGPSLDEQLGIESAQLGLEEARKTLRELGKAPRRKAGEKPKPREKVDPLEQRRAALDVRRAEQDLARAQGANADRVIDARKGVESATAGVKDAEQARLDATQAVIDADTGRRDAATKLADAQDKVRQTAGLVAQAERDSLKPAQDAADKQAALNEAFHNGTLEAIPFLKYLTDLKTIYPELGGVLDDYIKKFQGLAGIAPDKIADWKKANPTGGEPTAADLEGFYTMDDMMAWYQDHPNDLAPGTPTEMYGYAKRRQAGAGNLTVAPAALTATPTATPIAPSQLQGQSVSIGDIYVSGPDPVATAAETRRQLRRKAFLAGVS